MVTCSSGPKSSALQRRRVILQVSRSSLDFMDISIGSAAVGFPQTPGDCTMMMTKQLPNQEVEGPQKLVQDGKWGEIEEHLFSNLLSHIRCWL